MVVLELVFEYRDGSFLTPFSSFRKLSKWPGLISLTGRFQGYAREVASARTDTRTAISAPATGATPT